VHSESFVNALKAEKYDMFIIDLYPDQEFLAAYLEIPIVIRIVEDPVDVLFDKRKPFHSS
jgi:hypothetical protein